jgi:hypothetical protein
MSTHVWNENGAQLWTLATENLEHSLGLVEEYTRFINADYFDDEVDVPAFVACASGCFSRYPNVLPHVSDKLDKGEFYEIYGNDLPTWTLTELLVSVDELLSQALDAGQFREHCRRQLVAVLKDQFGEGLVFECQSAVFTTEILLQWMHEVQRHSAFVAQSSFKQ